MERLFMFSPVFKDIYIYNLQSRNCVVDVFFKVCVCVQDERNTDLDPEPSQLIFFHLRNATHFNGSRVRKVE